MCDRVACALHGGVQAPVLNCYHSASCGVPRITVQTVLWSFCPVEVQASYHSAGCVWSVAVEVRASFTMQGRVSFVL